MGPLTWVLSGAASALFARAVKRHRLHFLVEFIIAVTFAFAAGLAATALDFGGWSELEARAIAFSFFTSAAGIALSRLAVFPFRQRISARSS